MIYYNLSKTQLKAIADKLNYEFDSERLEIPKPLDPYDLVDHIGAKTDWIYITPTQSVLGLVAFDDMTWYAWQQPYYEKGMIPQVIFVPKGTILIDRTVVDSDERERERFIVIHECFHYLIHPKYFRISDGMGQYCKKESFNPWAKERSKMTALGNNRISGKLLRCCIPNAENSCQQGIYRLNKNEKHTRKTFEV